MKRILLLSYHFPPLSVIASLRAQAFAKWLGASGWDVTVVAPNWADESKEVQEIQGDGFRLLALPILHLANARNSPIKTFLQYQKGHFDLHARLPEFRRQELAFLRELHASESFDVLFGIYSPHYHLEHCHLLSQEWGIPYMLDFRDLWDPRVLGNNLRLTRKERLQWRLIQSYWKRWTSGAILISTVSEPYARFIGELSGRPTVTITNGFEADLFSKVVRQPQEGFVVAHVGSFYPQQQVEFLFEAVAKVLHVIPHIQLHFVGVKDSVMQKRLEHLGTTFGLTNHLKIEGRLPRAEALQRMVNSDVLYYPAWCEYEGVYSGKIFEYLASGRPIAVAPGDGGIVDALMQETGAGKPFSTAAALGNWLTDLHAGKNLPQCNESAIQHYTRQRQVEHFGRLLNQAYLGEGDQNESTEGE